MQLKVKKLHVNAVVPSYAKHGDAGLDLTAVTMEIKDDYIEYGTGLAIQLPEGTVGLLYPRSSISNKELMLSNSVGVVDASYRGEVKLRFKYNQKGPSPKEHFYKIGDRIAQLIVTEIPKMEIEEVTELSTTERGTGSYGSTGA